MSTSETLKRLVAKQTDIAKLKSLRDIGLAKMVEDTKLSDFTQADADELVTTINDKIIELGGTP